MSSDRTEDRAASEMEWHELVNHVAALRRELIRLSRFAPGPCALCGAATGRIVGTSGGTAIVDQQTFHENIGWIGKPHVCGPILGYATLPTTDEVKEEPSCSG